MQSRGAQPIAPAGRGRAGDLLEGQHVGPQVQDGVGLLVEPPGPAVDVPGDEGRQ